MLTKMDYYRATDEIRHLGECGQLAAIIQVAETEHHGTVASVTLGGTATLQELVEINAHVQALGALLKKISAE